jgi:hypothetical protein
MPSIKKEEIINNGILTEHIKQLEQVLELNKEIDAQLKKTATTRKSAVGSGDTKSVKRIREINKGVQESINLKKASVAVDKKITSLTDEQVRAKELLKRANKEQRDSIKAQIVLNDKLAGEEEKLLATNTKLRLERKKLLKADKNYEADLKRLNSALDKNNAKILKNSDSLKKQRMNVGNYGQAVGKITNIIKGFGVAALASFSFSAVKSFFTDSVNAFRVQEKAVAKVTQAINSTGGAAGKTTKELEKLAQGLQGNSLFGDEDILNNVSAQLLTFTNITGKEFDRTQQVALDLATVLDGDLKSASIQLGKALNDPVANLSALSRSGIQFSDDQKKTIKSLTETNQLAEAQNVILTELERQYGGQALAAAEADGGFTQLKNTFGDLMEIVGGALLDAIRPLIKDLKEFLANLSEEDIEEFTKALKSMIDGIITLSKFSFESIKGVFDFIDAWSKAFDSLENFKDALYETIDGFTSLITLGFVNDLSEDIRGLDKATEEYNAEQRENIRITTIAQKGIKRLSEAVGLNVIAEQQRITALADGNLTQDERNVLIADLNKKYPELIKNYDLENLSQEEAIQLNQDLKKEIIDIAILKEKSLALTFLNLEVEKEIQKAGKITNAETRQRRLDEIEFTKKVQLDRIDAIEKETRIRLGLEEEVKDSNTAILKNAEDNDAKRVKSAKKTSKKIIDQAEIEEQRIFDLRQQRLSDQADNEKENEKIREENAKKEADRVAKQNADQEKAEEQRRERERLAEEKRLKQFKENIKLTADLLKAAADARESKLDNEIDSAQDRIDESQQTVNNLQSQANLGNLDAQASIKAEKEAIANEKLNIEALEKKKRNLQILVTGLAVANEKIQSGDGNALANAGSDMASFIGKLKGFYDGTETTLGADLGNAYAITGDRDTHIIKAHKDEHIIGVENSRKLGNMNQDDIVKGALMLKNGEFVNNRVIGNMTNVNAFNDARMITAMNKIEKSINNIKIPEHKFNYDAISKMAIEQMKVGNKTTNNHTKIGGRLW